MKLLFILVFLPLFFVQAQSNSARDRELKQKGVDAFKGPSDKKMKNQKFKQAYIEKFFNFETDRVSPTFDGSLFYFNHLMPNMSTAPKFITEILTDTETTMIPGSGDCDTNPDCIPDRWETTETKRENVIRAKQEWKISFGPAFFFDIDYGEFVLNQSEGSQVLLGNSQTVGGNKYTAMLTPESGTGGPYLLRKFTKITAGMGGVMGANVANAGVLSQAGAALAIVPTIGGGKITESYLGSLEEARSKKHIEIPDKAEDFDSWQINDLLQYDVHGGITFAGGVGFYGLSAGVTYTAAGIWQRTFKKLDSRRIQAQLDRNKLMSFGAYAGAAVVSLSIDKFIQWENGLSYIFDLSNSEGKELLKDFMKGNIKNIQKALEGRSRSAVTFASQKIGKTSGWSGSYGIGIPFIPASARWGRSNMFAESETTYLDSTRERNETRAGKVITFKGKLFPLFKTVNDGFFSQVANTTGAIDFIWGNIKSGQYAYTYQRSRATRNDILKVLMHLRKKTGLFNFLNIDIPENVSELGSVDLKFAFKLKTPATQFLIAQKDTNNFEIVANKFINAYFDYAKENKIPEKEDLCSLGKRIRGCQEAYLKDTMKAVSEMKNALNVMAASQSYAVKDRERFAKAYAEFGDAMSSNPFTFQTVVNMTKGRGGDVYFSLESTNLKKFETVMRWKERR
ncbi:MAG: hypothetical protein ACHQYQ_07210 [Bacteriovoracales bacterium]